MPSPYTEAMEETEIMPESIRPTLPNEDALAFAWLEVSEPALAGIRVFQKNDMVAVLIHRGELWDMVVTRGHDRPESGVLKGAEVIDALNALVDA